MKRLSHRFTAVSFIAAMLMVLNVASTSAQELSGADKKTHDSLKEWVYFLASDEMGGRANGSPEMKVAAEYIAGIFKSAGLIPGFGDSYIKDITFTARNRTISERNVSAVIPGSDPALK
ncbi:MAG: hypothetical protein IH591_13440, partial [Bacteroidales bacterium]|nr:hypothetical protein [Bacteroidales bacterium]